MVKLVKELGPAANTQVYSFRNACFNVVRMASRTEIKLSALDSMAQVSSVMNMAFKNLPQVPILIHSLIASLDILTGLD
jgi:hypothetical protein